MLAKLSTQKVFHWQKIVYKSVRKTQGCISLSLLARSAQSTKSRSRFLCLFSLLFELKKNNLTLRPESSRFLTRSLPLCLWSPYVFVFYYWLEDFLSAICHFAILSAIRHFVIFNGALVTAVRLFAINLKFVAHDCRAELGFLGRPKPMQCTTPACFFFPLWAVVLINWLPVRATKMVLSVCTHVGSKVN